MHLSVDNVLFYWNGGKSEHGDLSLFGSRLWKNEPVPSYKEHAEIAKAQRPAVTSAG